MFCQDTRELLIDVGLALGLEADVAVSGRQRLADAFAHLQSCASCQRAMVDYDRLGTELNSAGRSVDASQTQAELADFRNSLLAVLEHAQSAPVTPLRSRSEPIALVDRPSDVPSSKGHWTIGPSVGFFGKRGVRIAAALALAMAGFLAGKSMRQPVPAIVSTIVVEEKHPIAATSKPAAIIADQRTQNQIANQVALFKKVNQQFDGHARWVLSAPGGGADFGLDEHYRASAFASTTSPIVTATPGQLMFIHLKLADGSTVLSDADLVIVAGRTADIAVLTPSGQSLRYRLVTSASNPERVQLSAQVLAVGSHQPTAALAKRIVLQQDQSTAVGQLVTPDGEFDLAVSYTSPL